MIFEFSFVYCLLACKEKLFLHYLFIFFMYLFKSVWTHGSLILIYRLLSLFIVMLRFTQIWPVGAKTKKCFLRGPAGKKFDKRSEKVHPWWAEVPKRIKGNSTKSTRRRMLSGRRTDNSSTELIEKKERKKIDGQWQCSRSWEVCSSLCSGKEEVKWFARSEEAVGGHDIKWEEWQCYREWKGRWLPA